MRPNILVLNGPNLNLLGLRQPEIYGRETLADVEAMCRALAAEFGVDLEFRQSNAEHQLIDWIHAARTKASGLIINPAAYSHTSIAILDALKTCEFPIVEVHISNIHRREDFRHHSYVSLAATGIIAGLGVNGYALALRHLAFLLAAAKA
jgi:3-dehydroquinate dehydratase-2